MTCQGHHSVHIIAEMHSDPKKNVVYADSSQCCFQVENLCKVAEQAGTAAVGTLIHPEEISTAE